MAYLFILFITLFINATVLNIQDYEIFYEESKSLLVFQHQEFSHTIKFKENRGYDEFNMTVKFAKFECEWETKHLYYTTDTHLDLKVNFHCHDDKKCKPENCFSGNYYYNKTKELTVKYSKNLCSQVKANNFYCFPNLKVGCLFYSWSIMPDFTKIYEVREAIENFCRPTMIITINRRDEQPEQHILEKASYTYEYINEKTYTYDRFRFQLKGLQKVPLKEPIYLLNPIENPSIVYFVQASPPGIPKNYQIGEFQSLDINFTNIVIDENMVQCQTEYNKVSCEKTNFNIKRYLQIKPSIKVVGQQDKTNTLLGIHSYYINRKNRLITILNKIKPITVTITHNRHERVDTDKMTACIYRIEYISMSGCYSCEIPAILKLKIDNFCDEGNIFIELDFANIYQQAIYIYSNTTWINVHFRAEQECLKGEICMKNDYEIRPSCVYVSGCLTRNETYNKATYLSIIRESKVIYVLEQNRNSILYYFLPQYIQNNVEEGLYIILSDFIFILGILILIYLIITLIFTRLTTLGVRMTELEFKVIPTYCRHEDEHFV